MHLSSIRRAANRFLSTHAIGHAGRYVGDDLLPPEWMFSDPDRVDGSHDVKDFIYIGEGTVSWFVEWEGLASHHRVLDIGCGIGRIARPLTRHLKAPGCYDGIEIAPYKVKYCRQAISRRFSNFRFHHADVFNKYYNPKGKMQASQYNFPFAEDTFDFVYLVSVFTHMLVGDTEHYVSEIARVLKPGAKCIASFWLAEARIGNPYYYYSDVCEIYDPKQPEYGVIYVENYVRDLYTRLGLEISIVRHGYWTRRPDSSNSHMQDIVVATKFAP